MSCVATAAFFNRIGQVRHFALPENTERFPLSWTMKYVDREKPKTALIIELGRQLRRPNVTEGRTMYLSRITPPWKEGLSGTVTDNYKIAQSDFDEGTGDWIVVAEFPHFGEAERHRSDFEVEIAGLNRPSMRPRRCCTAPGATRSKRSTKGHWPTEPSRSKRNL